MINKNQLNKSPQDFKFKLIKHDFQDSEDWQKIPFVIG